ncbi:hypothetical protein [Streptomyces sp. CA-132043]|uniref:hypothetical protein n=1 Tax=Streptomyces sp. CA-132043 TaxID=3240048 RepID=UPI003D89B67F
MQTKTINGNRSTGSRPARRESAPLLAGAAVAVGGVGAVLALADLASPLRAPFALFFLLAAPAAALAAALGRLDPLSRTVVAGAGAFAVDLLVAQTMLSLHIWSARGGVLAVAVISGTIFLLASVRRRGASAPDARTD